ncbi:MAG: hypothetical protein GTO63_18315, partial [Anaerolineae bacterium]|nr:hypothetical protein [Anaerolineae bacterium]NIN96725.1 hypothetical protein [Anaerolineae bacterium]
LLIVFGVQLITMGLLGELVVRTYHEAQNKPTYVLRDRLGTRVPRKARRVDVVPVPEKPV